MTYFAVWLDRAHAKVFQFSREKMERKTLNVDSSELLFHRITEDLSPADQVLVLGPGVAKHHFLNFLNEHFPLLSRKVIACETVDDYSDPQIAAYAAKYFRSKDSKV